MLLLLVLLPAWALLGYLTVGAVLSWPAELPHRADVVVVLGGGDGARYARGRELIVAGYSKHLILIEPSLAERKDALDHLTGVGIWSDVQPRGSWGEAKTTRERMQAHGWKSVLVVSDPPHMLRVKYAWASNLRGTGLTYTLIATNPPWWSAWRWWRTRGAADFVGDEVLKLGYYVLRYPLGFCIGGVCD